jgi:hypothetical protein
MRNFNPRFLLVLMFLVAFFPRLEAEDRRNVPLDVYLIIDASNSFQNVKTDALAWVNAQVIDRILIDGDNMTVWAAGDSPELIFSGAVSASNGNGEIKEKLNNLTAEGGKADFSGALRGVETRLSDVQGRLSYTLLIMASAGGLEGVLTGNSPSQLKWSRSEKYERWQVLVIAPNIGRKVSEAALEYMNYITRR